MRTRRFLAVFIVGVFALLGVIGLIASKSQSASLATPTSAPIGTSTPTSTPVGRPQNTPTATATRGEGIDDLKKQKQVEEIVSTDYFQRLREQAQSIRNRRKDGHQSDNPK